MTSTPDEVAALSPESIERLIERLHEISGRMVLQGISRDDAGQIAEAARTLESLRPKPEAGETPETDAEFKIYPQGWSTAQLNLCRSLELRLRALRGEREGMMLVPREPTEDQLGGMMLRYLEIMYPDERNYAVTQEQLDMMRSIYKSALAAVPKKTS